jgi:hypothetical protein
MTEMIALLLERLSAWWCYHTHWPIGRPFSERGELVAYWTCLECARKHEAPWK